MKHFCRKLISLCFAALLLGCLTISALAVPSRPENLYVLDSAEVLSEAVEQEIISENQKLFRETGAEIVIAAVDFLDGKSIDDYACQMFESWGVGSAERNNGLLLVLSIAEEDYYAISGYGIEDCFSGSMLDDLLYDNLEADFAAERYESGVLKFFRTALSEMKSYYLTYEDEYTGAFTEGGSVTDYDSIWESDYDDYFAGNWITNAAHMFFSRIFPLIVLMLIIIIFIFVLSRIRAGERRNTPYNTTVYRSGGSGFWQGMFLGSALNRRRNRYPNPPPPPGGFGTPGIGGRPSPPRSSGGFSRGGRSSFGSSSSHRSTTSHRSSSSHSSGFSRGGSTRGGGAGRRR